MYTAVVLLFSLSGQISIWNLRINCWTSKMIGQNDGFLVKQSIKLCYLIIDESVCCGLE